eukprot:6467179-Ditylum_brightwellii.AAC.1
MPSTPTVLTISEGNSNQETNPTLPTTPEEYFYYHNEAFSVQVLHNDSEHAVAVQLPVQSSPDIIAISAAAIARATLTSDLSNQSEWRQQP